MNPAMTRRGFALGAGVTVFSAITSRKGFSAQSQEQSVEVKAATEIGLVNPELHSSFAEHLGSCVYGGLWVGKNSKIPNINGYRRQAVEYLKDARHPGPALAGRLLRRRLPLARRHRARRPSVRRP